MDEKRFAVRSVLKKAAANKVTISISPDVHNDLVKAFKKIRVDIRHTHFGYPGGIENIKMEAPSTKFPNGLFEEKQQTEYHLKIGYGVLGSILPRLPDKTKKLVEESLRDQRIGVADTRNLKRLARSGYESVAGSWRWEDTTATWADLWDAARDKLVDAVAISEVIDHLEDTFEDEDEDEDW